MARWYPVDEVDESFFAKAPSIYRYPIEVPVPPERVWESLVSDESVGAWGPGVRSVHWSTPRPFGVGTTREVALVLNAVAVRERFFRWDEGRGYSFTAYETNRPLLRHFAEDYVIEATESGSRLTWTIALEATPKLRHLTRVTDPVNRFAFGRTAADARRYFARTR